MQYTYNAVGALEKVTQAVSGLSSGNTMSAEYTYSGDRITSMSHSGSVYTFEYNTFGNVTNIKVAGSADSENKQSIVSYGYDSKQRKNKKRVKKLKIMLDFMRTLWYHSQRLLRKPPFLKCCGAQIALHLI